MFSIFKHISQNTIEKEIRQIFDKLHSLNKDLLKSFMEKQDSYILHFYDYKNYAIPEVYIDDNKKYQNVHEIYENSVNFVKIFNIRIEISLMLEGDIITQIMKILERDIEKHHAKMFDNKKVYDYFHNTVNFGNEILVVLNNELIDAKFHCFAIKKEMLICKHGKDYFISIPIENNNFIKLTDEMKFFQCIKTLKT